MFYSPVLVATPPISDFRRLMLHTHPSRTLPCTHSGVVSYYRLEAVDNYDLLSLDMQLLFLPGPAALQPLPLVAAASRAVRTTPRYSLQREAPFFDSCEAAGNIGAKCCTETKFNQ